MLKKSTYNSTTTSNNSKNNNLSFSEKKHFKLIAFITFIFFATIISVILYSNFKKKTVNLNVEDYVLINVTGYNGTATATAVFYYDSFLDSLNQLSSSKDKDVNLKNYINVNISKESSISNGDVITVYINVDNKFNDIYDDIDIKSTSYVYNVKTLKDCNGTIDLFKDISVTYDGTSSNSIVNTSTNSFIKNHVYFSCANSLITAQFDENILNAYGYNVTETSKEYNFTTKYVTTIKSFNSSSIKQYINKYNQELYTTLVKNCENKDIDSIFKNASPVFIVKENFSPVTAYFTKNKKMPEKAFDPNFTDIDRSIYDNNKDSEDINYNNLAVIYKAVLHDDSSGDKTFYALLNLGFIVEDTKKDIVSSKITSISFFNTKEDALKSFKESVDYDYTIETINF